MSKDRIIITSRNIDQFRANLMNSKFQLRLLKCENMNPVTTRKIKIVEKHCADLEKAIVEYDKKNSGGKKEAKSTGIPVLDFVIKTAAPGIEKFLKEVGIKSSIFK